MAYTVIIPDEPEQIQAGLIKCAGEKGIHLMLTADGTGLSSRDVIPESTLTVVELEACGLSEAMRVEKGLLPSFPGSVGPRRFRQLLLPVLRLL